MKRIKKISLEILLIICAMFNSAVLVSANDEITLSLDNMKDTTRFVCEDMLPGDINTKTYKVNIAHSDTVTLYFDVNVTNVEHDLAKYLFVSVKDADGNGLIDSTRMDKISEKGVKINKGVDSFTYVVEVYLDGDYGSDEVVGLTSDDIPKVEADFSWYVKEADAGSMKVVDTATRGLISVDSFSFDTVLLLIILVGLIALFVVLLKKNTFKSKVSRITILVILGCLICVNTTYALFSAKLDLDDNIFSVKKYNCDIVVNGDNKATITTTSINEYFEPGRSRVAEFKVSNNGDIGVYYRFYFKNIEGILMNSMTLGIYSDSNCTNELLTIDGKDFDLNHSYECQNILKCGKTDTYYLLFKMKEESGNEYQSSYSDFVIEVEAIQAVNSGGFH